MPKYEQEHLTAIAQALASRHFNGLANTVLWWNQDAMFKSRFRIMRRPLKEMPLYVSNDDEGVRIVAAARLKIGR